MVKHLQRGLLAVSTAEIVSMFILGDTQTTGDNFDELPGHHFVIKEFDYAPSTCFAHPMTQWFVLHQSEQGFSDIVNIRAVTCYTRRVKMIR